MSGLMRGLVLTDEGRMMLTDLNTPTPKRGQVLVEVKVSAVNEMDVQVRAGGWAPQVRKFRKMGPVVTGFEFSGIARTDGDRIKTGQRVIGYVHVLNGNRTHAEFVCVNEGDLSLIPPDLAYEGAAALVVMGLTAIDLLERLKPLSRGTACLVIGAAGGVGAYVTQLAAFQGAQVTAVCAAGSELSITTLAMPALASPIASVMPTSPPPMITTSVSTAASASFIISSRKCRPAPHPDRGSGHQTCPQAPPSQPMRQA